jgi:hypothetical protein
VDIELNARQVSVLATSLLLACCAASGKSHFLQL